MARDRKQLLIVDDTEIDRIILKSILARDFDIIEASNGNIAFDYITKFQDQIDAILLDIVMPHIDGFDVLRFMQDKGMNSIPVFLVTAETTRDNVEKAVRFGVSDFIGKPFEREDVLRRLRSRLGLVPTYDLTKDDLKATQAYIADLEAFYKKYLHNFGKDDAHYRVMVDLMRILLTQYSRSQRNTKLNPESIELISKAAYFCDIGEMLVPDKRLQAMLDRSEEHNALVDRHTVYGSNLIRLNTSRSCEYFVEICASMCLHHHERYDGTGYPNGLLEENNSIYNQMCRLVDEFDQMRSKFYGDKSRPVKFVSKRLLNSEGLVSPKLLALLENSESLLVDYFMKADT